MENVNFLGQKCYLLSNDVVELLVTNSVGPRILSYRFLDGGNLFAELPDHTTNCPGKGVYHFYGGHRLWHAPEEPSRTYLPDDSPVDMCVSNKGLLITQQVESQTGLQKSLEIQLTQGTTRVVVTHRLTNHGPWSVNCAPWAITQLKVGGTAILPQAQNHSGVLPNRSVTLWTYTDMNNSSVYWGKSFILICANMDRPFKVGFPNPRGWQAYWLDGWLFVKRAKYESQVEYFDFGSSSECYCDSALIELETLAPVSTIVPDATVSHVETWELFKDVDFPENEKTVQTFVDKLELDRS